MERMKCCKSGMRCHCANCDGLFLTFEWQEAVKDGTGEKYDLGRILARCDASSVKDRVYSEPFEVPDLNGESVWIAWRAVSPQNLIKQNVGTVVSNKALGTMTMYESTFRLHEIPEAWRKIADDFIDSHDCVIPLRTGKHAKRCKLYAERSIEKWSKQK